jgi:hypothetical protein
MISRSGKSFAVLIVSGLALMFPESWALGQGAPQKDKPGFAHGYLIGGSRSVGFGMGMGARKGLYLGIELALNKPKPPSDFKSEMEMNFPIGVSIPLSSRVTWTTYGLVGWAGSARCVDRIPDACRRFNPAENPEQAFSDSFIDYQTADYLNSGGGMQFTIQGKKQGFTIGVRYTKRSSLSVTFGCTR